MFENLVLGTPRDRPMQAEVVYYNKVVKAGRGKRRAWGALVSPIYILRNVLYGRLLPYADAIVDVEPDESGKLIAKITKGRGCKPRWAHHPLVRNWHTIAVASLCVYYFITGVPHEGHCAVAAWTSRALIVVAIVVINGAMY